VEELKYMGTNLTNQNSTQEEIKSRVKSGKACCHTEQKHTFSNWSSNNLRSTIYTTIILPYIYGCETWSFILREESGFRVFGNRELRRIFLPKR
jgi:hypothetical protein